MFFAQVDGTEVYQCEFPLPAGMNGASKQKFAAAVQQQIFERVCKEFEEGKIQKGSWEAGEIELLRPLIVIANRFWHEVIWEVAFPPKKVGDQPVVGQYRWIEWNVGMDSGAAALCVSKNGLIVLVKNYRHASRAWRLEIPRGIRKHGETVEKSAFREALEEAGITPSSTTKAIDLGRFEPDSGLARMTPSLFVLTDIVIDESKIRRDVSESIGGYFALPVLDVMNKINRGEILDSYTEVALYRAIARQVLKV